MADHLKHDCAILRRIPAAPRTPRFLAGRCGNGIMETLNKSGVVIAGASAFSRERSVAGSNHNPFPSRGYGSPRRYAPRDDGLIQCILICACLVLFAALFASGAAAAEELPDPTRPPPGIFAAPESEVSEPQSAGLQSIIISPKRRAAIIDGETVELGARHGDAKLVEVNEGSVVLLGAHGRQVLSLFPDVKMSGKKVKAKLQSPAGKVQSGKRQAGQAAPAEDK